MSGGRNDFLRHFYENGLVVLVHRFQGANYGLQFPHLVRHALERVPVRHSKQVVTERVERLLNVPKHPRELGNELANEEFHVFLYSTF